MMKVPKFLFDGQAHRFKIKGAPIKPIKQETESEYYHRPIIYLRPYIMYIDSVGKETIHLVDYADIRIYQQELTSFGDSWKDSIIPIGLKSCELNYTTSSSVEAPSTRCEIHYYDGRHTAIIIEVGAVYRHSVSYNGYGVESSFQVVSEGPVVMKVADTRLGRG